MPTNNFSQWLEQTWDRAGYPIRLNNIKHGNLTMWLTPLDRLHFIEPSSLSFSDTVEIGSQSDLVKSDLLTAAIEALIPWRKGPFKLFGQLIEAEWQSHLKWRRLQTHIDLTEHEVLDVGSGNGYYGYRMLESGAKSVLAIESTIPYVLQAALLQFYARANTTVIPMRFGEQPLGVSFDTVFSMGVLYHQRDADKHLLDLAQVCKLNGQLVLETLIAVEDFKPTKRYAGMRNVWGIPSLSTLHQKLESCGFTDVRVIDVSETTIEEQRQTRHMPFKSLADSLDSKDSSITIEGYPSPERAVLLARRQ